MQLRGMVSSDHHPLLADVVAKINVDVNTVRADVSVTGRNAIARVGRLHNVTRVVRATQRSLFVFALIDT
jgi:hypothetical protein